MKSEALSALPEARVRESTAPNSERHWSIPPALRDIALLGLLPVALLVLNRNWIISGLFNDPWIYFGYYFNLPGHLRAFTHAYYGSRLSVIVPGYVVYHVLPPLTANLVLHLALYEAGVLAVYFLLARVEGRRAALLGSVLMGTNPFYLEAVGHDYVDGFGIVYFLVAEMTLALGATWRRPGIVAAAAGAAAGAMVVANVTYALFLPLIGLFLLVTFLPRGKGAVVRGCVAFAIGGGAFLMAMCLLNAAITGRFSFLAPNFEFINKTFKLASPYKDRAFAWVLYGTWLATPALAAALATARLVRLVSSRSGALSASAVCLLGQYLAYFVFAVLLELATRVIYLQAWYYASLLIPMAALALPLSWRTRLDCLPRRRFAALVLAAVLASAPAIAVSRGGPPAILGLPPMVMIAVLSVAVLAVWLDRSAGFWSCTAALVLYGVIQCVAWSGFREEISTPVLNEDPDYWKLAALRQPPRRVKPYGARMHDYDDSRVDVLESVAETVRALRDVDTTGNLYFWFDLAEPHGVLFNNIACTQTWGPRVFTLDFPATLDGRTLARERMAPGMKLVILTARPGALPRARRALHSLGLDAQVLDERAIKHGDIAFTVTSLELVGRAESP